MNISLLHAGLAGGAALAVVPLILHLLMRQTPKHVIFPALRLIRERQKQSKKRLRVKNWLLLIARMALFALMALALARPTLHTESLLGAGEVDTAIALVVDTSLSMEYTEKGNDRLKEAKLRVADILKKATDRSEVFVIDSAEAGRPGPASPAVALKQVEALTLRDANRPLNAAVVQAYAAVAASELPRKEIYVLTDLAKSAWDMGSATIAEAAKKANAPKVTINAYVLRLTPKEVKDVAIVAADPASTVAPQGEPLEIKVRVRSWGPKVAKAVKLYLDKLPRGSESIELPENGEAEVTLDTPATLAPGLHQGEVRLEGGGDNMAFDDIRYFTFTVQPAQRVLIVAGTPEDGFFAQNALEPAVSRPGMAHLVKVDRMTPAEFAEKGRGKLEDYATVFFLNVPNPSEADWGALNAYVRSGGGLVVALGDRIDPASYNGPVASQLLPAKVDSPRKRPDGTTFARPDLNHPVFLAYRPEIESALAAKPVYRSWSITPHAQASRTLLAMSDPDHSPAAVERAIPGTKTGHVILWTVPFRNYPFGAQSWSEIWDDWPFLAILLQSIAYLSGTAGEQFNYEAGQDVILPIDPEHRPSNVALMGPEPTPTTPLPTPTTTDKLLVPAPQARGHWRVEGKTSEGGPVVLGFSVNPPESEATVVPLKEEELVALFGAKDNVQLADDAAGLERAVNRVHVGREMFPWLMMLILVLVTCENLLANKFHRERAATA